MSSKFNNNTNRGGGTAAVPRNRHQQQQRGNFVTRPAPTFAANGNSNNNNKPSSSSSNSGNKSANPPINKNSLINIDLAAHVAKNKNQFAVDGESTSQQQQRKFNNRPVDDYGRGAPTDRLIFGYAPSVPAEAVAFHSRFPVKKWKIERRIRYKNRCLRQRSVFLQEQAAVSAGTLKTAGLLNFEPEASAIKLRLYWIEKVEEERKLLSGAADDDKNESATATTSSIDVYNRKNKKPTAGASSPPPPPPVPSNANDNTNKGSKSGGGDGSFGKLLSDMFGGEYTSEAPTMKESGQRRQREEV